MMPKPTDGIKGPGVFPREEQDRAAPGAQRDPGGKYSW
ncbi:MAG: hypothetical protein CM15mV144_440 [Caudoviricetes sp.]|nr:MAG: hypothetical protein CM15mV144_440 [Caudoviricetes sp.]